MFNTGSAIQPAFYTAPCSRKECDRSELVLCILL